MAKKSFLERLQKLDGAVVGDYNVHSNVIRSRSPSLNFTFGNAHGLPRGFTLALYGPEKSGKSLITTDMAGSLHYDDPEAYVINFSTEFRVRGQLSHAQLEKFGVDRSRYVAYEVNTPDKIFDRIEKEIAAECQDGLNCGLIIIDSINSIQGRRGMNADTVMTQQIGDLALTLQDGFKRILPIQRKYNIAVALVAQARDELDPLQQMRGKKFKMAAARAVRHYAEYFMCVEKNENKEGKADLLGHKFEDESKEDVLGNAERTGHKIKATMIDSSLGPKGRVGMFTLGYEPVGGNLVTGVVNAHEEVFLLGSGRGVIQRPNQTTYVFGERKWVGKEAMIEALRTDSDLSGAVQQKIREMDLARNGNYADESVPVDSGLED